MIGVAVKVVPREWGWEAQVVRSTQWIPIELTYLHNEDSNDPKQVADQLMHQLDDAFRQHVRLDELTILDEPAPTDTRWWKVGIGILAILVVCFIVGLIVSVIYDVLSNYVP